MLFFKRHARKLDRAIGLDIGSRQLKAVYLSRGEKGVELLHYALEPNPAGFGKAGSEPVLAEAIQKLFTKLKIDDRRVYATISAPSALVNQVTMPKMPLLEAQAALKLSGTRYVRHDLATYYSDIVELTDGTVDSKGRKVATMQLLVAGALKEEVQLVRNAFGLAKVKADAIELTAVSVINALQHSHAALCEQEVVLLLDVGAQMTSLNFLRRGQPFLTRLMQFGGAAITEEISQRLTLPPEVAEEEKLKMSDAVAMIARGALQTLVREVRSSIDFVERQHDCQIKHAFLGGGSACDAKLVEFLAEDIGMPLERWNPLEGVSVAVSGEDTARLAAVTPSLAAAVGAAVVRL